MSSPEQVFLTPVWKSVTVKAAADHAFRVFTDEIDSWWLRSHHIGKTPMTRNVIEGRRGGRCYSEHADGTECQWGTILIWEPPHRFVMAWQVSPTWEPETDLSKSSEVEVRFTPEGETLTRIDLVHRHFERHGGSFHDMRTGVDSPDGWNGLLQVFLTRAEQRATEPGDTQETTRGSVC